MNNRELKFRVWDIKNKKFEYIENINLVGDCTIDDRVEQQYIGLRDKLERYIYEGDILQLKRPNTNKDTVMFLNREVVFRLGAFSVEFYDGFWTPLSLIAENKDGIEMEIIGNIFENPLLLKVVEVKEEDTIKT